MATSVANVTLGQNAVTAITSTAATADTADLAEVFTITPTKPDHKMAILIKNVSGVNGSVTFSLASGDFWPAKAALTGSVAQGVSSMIKVESAKYMKKDGTYALTITPASGKRLKTDHTLAVSVVQL